MDVLQLVLVILVSVWTAIFVVVAVAVYLIFRSIKRSVDKVNNILDATEEIAEGAKIPSKIAMAAVVGFLAKNSIDSIKNVIAGALRRGSKDKP